MSLLPKSFISGAVSRRTMLQSAVAGFTSIPLSQRMANSQSTPNPGAHQMGIASTSYLGFWRPTDTIEFLERCHGLGAAGIQAVIHGDPADIRKRSEQYGMYFEAMVPLPHGTDTTEFEQSLKAAQAAGAVALRSACLGTRRYETFTTLADWQAFVGRSHRSLEAALPLLDRYKIPLGLENHKDWTADEMVSLQKKYSSEYLGICIDFGNNISLLDDPMDLVEKFAPYAVCTHLKDMGVEPAADGFLLSEVLLGDGFLDLPRMISLIRQARPSAHFSLEMITRDPLHVPCLSDKYWVTFPNRNGIYLARTLRLVAEHRSARPLPRVAQLSREEALKLENDNVIACLDYSHKHLSL